MEYLADFINSRNILWTYYKHSCKEEEKKPLKHFFVYLSKKEKEAFKSIPVFKKLDADCYLGKFCDNDRFQHIANIQFFLKANGVEEDMKFCDEFLNLTKLFLPKDIIIL